MYIYSYISMEFEEDMRPEKRTPNYFNELSGFEEEHISHMTINNCHNLYEIEMKKNNIEINYASDDDFYP